MDESNWGVRCTDNAEWCVRCDLNRACTARGECSTCDTMRKNGNVPFDERPDVYEGFDGSDVEGLSYRPSEKRYVRGSDIECSLLRSAKR